MMHTLDRALLFTFLRSYAIVLVSLLSLYIVIDLFTNIDTFLKQGSLEATFRHIGRYYLPRISQIFDKLAESVTLLAAMFTVSWLQRNNELLPQLSAGVSAHRVLRPVLLGTLVLAALPSVNQELVIPRIADALLVPRDDPEQKNGIEMRGAFDSTGVHVEAERGYRKGLRAEKFFVTFPESWAMAKDHVQAEEAEYLPPGGGPLSGGWMLYNTTPDVIPGPLPEGVVPAGPRRYFLRVREADFDSLTRNASWHALADVTKLRGILSRPDPRRMAPVAVAFHMRLTRPLVGVLMVVFGLSIILKDHNRHVLISAGLCLLMCALFYAVVFGCKYLGENDLLSPPLAAWLPVLLFGPVVLVQFDAIQT